MDVTENLVSIGEVAEETGLTPEVLRVWERRYGFPVPVRLPSGHRRYRAEDLRRLRLVALALAQGRRAAQVVPLGEEALQALVGPKALSTRVTALLATLETLDSPAIRRQLHDAHQSRGLLPFLCEIVSPLLDEVGRRWAAGSMGIQHEHLLTELLEDLLRDLRRSFQPGPAAPTVVLATLPGEHHRLGLLMAALVYAAQGARVELLGTDLPLAALVGAVKDLEAGTVGVSLSLRGGGELAHQMLRDLRERLPQSTRLIVGGQGAARLRAVVGVTRIRGLEVGR